MNLYPVGFINFNGAACWLNSMTQAILGSSHINKFIYELDLEQQIRTGKIKEASKLLRYYKVIVDYSAKNKGSMSLTQIMQVLSNKPEEIRELMRQNDPTEYIMRFISGLHEEVIELCAHAVCSTIICKDHRHRKKQNGLLLAVSLNHINDLQNYLIQHKETLEYKCDMTTADRNAKPDESVEKIRLLQLSHAPKVLLVMVKNYLFNPNNQLTINYPDTLKFKKLDNSFWQYKIKSVVEHFGTKSVNNLIKGHSGGHYVCTSQRKDGIYHLNDSSASKVNAFPKTPNVCMLVYER